MRSTSVVCAQVPQPCNSSAGAANAYIAAPKRHEAAVPDRILRASTPQRNASPCSGRRKRDFATRLADAQTSAGTAVLKRLLLPQKQGRNTIQPWIGLHALRVQAQGDNAPYHPKGASAYRCAVFQG
eukprot:10450394-Alexandrium_andersonii.AAC.1